MNKNLSIYKAHTQPKTEFIIFLFFLPDIFHIFLFYSPDFLKNLLQLIGDCEHDGFIWIGAEDIAKIKAMLNKDKYRSEFFQFL